MKTRCKTAFAAICVLLSFLLQLPLTAKAAELEENSWRYENGALVCNEQVLLLSATAWSKVGDSFFNNAGEVIEGAIKKGIDVSHHQGTIDWITVKQTDVDYAIIRCGYGDNLTSQDDRQWYTNADACTELGIPFGVYIYSYAKTIEEAESEAAHVLRLVEGYDLSYPIYLDLEDNESVGSCSNTRIGEIAQTFCDIIQNAGYEVGIYASTHWWNTRLTSSVFSNSSWHKWVAHYASKCGYTGDYTMWQATNEGQVSGISGNVDINFLFAEIGTDTEWNESYPNFHVNTGDYVYDLVEIAKNQIGYTELTEAGGTPVIDSATRYYTKYGAAYGDPTGHWCAYFTLWCANQAGIPTSIICKSGACGNCNYFVNWFKENHRWKESNGTPKKGDFAFYDWNGDGIADHVGIVSEVKDGYIFSIEGNTGGVNGYTVIEQLRSENILGYGSPNYTLKDKLNGRGLTKQTAYMLPGSSANKVWEIWKDDELQVLCEDGGYYLVLYPYVYTGKFVAAYIPKGSAEVLGAVPSAEEFYTINEAGTVSGDTVVYHNASEDDLMGSSANHKVRANLLKNDTVTVLFEESGFYFVKTNQISGYVLKSQVSLCSDAEEQLLGDLNGDLKINSADAGLILRYDAGIISLSQEQLAVADINRDGKVDSADAGLILRYDAGIIQTFN